VSGRKLFRSPDGNEANVLRAWHTVLLDDRGERARLRRARTPEDAAMTPGFHQLLRRLDLAPRAEHGGLPVAPRQLAALAGAAALAARIDGDLPGTRLGATLRGPDPGSPRVSETRFRRLVALEEEPLAERFTILRRLIDLVGKRADLAQVAGALCDWTPERKRRLAYDYYATSIVSSEENQ
jgi:CRISPR system Cascade subunit CasB